MTHRVDIKPLSVNEAWQGRRFRSNKYKAYRWDVWGKLPDQDKIEVPAKIWLRLEFGFANRASDIDNGLKPFIDILQKKYNFDDKNIFQLDVKKITVERPAKPFITFEILKYEE